MVSWVHRWPLAALAVEILGLFRTTSIAYTFVYRRLCRHQPTHLSHPSLTCRLHGAAVFDAFYESLGLVDAVQLDNEARPQSGFLRYQVQFCLGLKVWDVVKQRPMDTRPWFGESAKEARERVALELGDAEVD